jgi:hypothetical protein
MPHDYNGHVGPPRCQECNAPLTSDECRLNSTNFFCLDCQPVVNPFPRRKRRRRLLIELLATERIRSIRSSSLIKTS